jgi:hypothetical protein
MMKRIAVLPSVGEGFAVRHWDAKTAIRVPALLALPRKMGFTRTFETDRLDGPTLFEAWPATARRIRQPTEPRRNLSSMGNPQIPLDTLRAS